jgi:hypothetical protein
LGELHEMQPKGFAVEGESESIVDQENPIKHKLQSLTPFLNPSGGGAAFAQAMAYALANGSSGLGGNSVRFDGGANNAIMTDRIARTAGVSTGYYYSHADFVPNVIGTNGNLVSMAVSIVILPTLFVGPPLSPHTKPTPNYTYRQGNVAPSGPPVLAPSSF